MRAIIFDNETTGLPKHRRAKMSVQPKVIEFGALLVDEHGTEIESLNIMLDPGEPLEAIITKITGITDKDLMGQPKFADVLPQIAALFAKADVMIAHNLPFDEMLIALELERAGCTDFPWPAFRLCTVQENVQAWGRRPKLTELYERVIGMPLAQTHRALDDCHALAAIVVKENYLDIIKRFIPAAASQDGTQLQKGVRKSSKGRRAP